VKINERESLNITNTNSDRISGPSKPGSTPTASKTQNGSDGVDTASQSGLLSQTLDAGSADRASLVEQLRAVFQSGQYQVDTGALSQAIVSGALNGY